MKTLKWSLIIVITSLIVLFTCRNTSPGRIIVDPAYSKYVSGFTGGKISRTSSIRIELVNPFSPEGDSSAFKENALPDSNVLKNILSFEPTIKGRIHWLNNRVIEFVPAEPLTSGTLYTAGFKLHKVANVPYEYRNMDFQFSTWKQRLIVISEGLKNYDQFRTDKLYLTGTFTTRDYCDTAMFRKVMWAEQDGKRLPSRWEYSVSEEKYRFYFDNVTRSDHEGSVVMYYSGKSIDSEDEGEETFRVTANGNFQLESVTAIDNGDQKLQLIFSEPIYPEQSFERFIGIRGSDQKLRFSTDRNEVTVYLEDRLTGTYSVDVKPGLLNFGKSPLKNAQSQSITLDPPNPLIRFIGKGSILPNSQGLKIPLETINLRSVDVRVIRIYENNIHQFLQVNELNEDDRLSRVGKIVFEKKMDLGIKDSVQLLKWRRSMLDLSKLIQPEPGCLYRISVKFKASYTGCGCDAEYEYAGYNDEENQDSGDEDWHTGSFAEDIDYDYRYYGYDEYNDNVEGDPCSNDYYYGKALNRNILASDLGIIYKSDIQKVSNIYVSNLITAKPAAGTNIELFNYTKQKVGSAVTDSNGMARIKPTDRPFLLVAAKGRQKGYLKLNPANSNSLSRFDTDGESMKGGLRGFIYAERGVWRPGDSIFLTWYLHHPDKPLPANHPYTVELLGPSGESFEKRTQYLKEGDLDVLVLTTPPTAPTGNYQAIVTLGNLKVTKNLNIETVMPNRLKIKLQLPEGGIQYSNLNPGLRMEVKWLHGSPAPGLKASTELTLKNETDPFPAFKNYKFSSPSEKNYYSRLEIFNGKLDPQGAAVIQPKIMEYSNLPGVLQASFVNRVYENSGAMSIDKSDIQIFPFQRYVGMQIPGNENAWLNSGKSHFFSVICVDPKGNTVVAEKLEVSIYKLEWKWWYERNEDEGTDYLSRPSTYLVKDTVINVAGIKSGFRFGIPNYQWGRYLIRVKDPLTGHVSGDIVNFDSPYGGRDNSSDNDGATMLSLSTDKKKYKTGENIQIRFPSSAGSRALISVETGNSLVQSFWVNTRAGETPCTVKVTGAMFPNAYIHVSLIQPHLQTINDLPIRMYGVVPVSISEPKTELHPVIASAATFKPQSTQSIVVSELSGQTMFYTLAIVDEGLLDLTHFKTPDPHSHIYTKNSLGVKTWDVYSNVIGAHSGKMDHLLSIGGDGSYDDESASKAQRFIPMVRFIGPFRLAAGGKNSHKISIPNYMGSVRIMVVARNNKAYGSAQKDVAVKQELMVLPTLPRVLGPGETVRIPVTVFSTEKAVRIVAVKISAEGPVTVTGNPAQFIEFAGPGEEIIYYEMKTGLATGIVKFHVNAKSGNFNANSDLEIALRSQNPVESRSTDIILNPGEQANIPIAWFGLKGSNSLNIQTGGLPAGGIGNRYDYLIEYPYGCIEQTTSAALAQLYLPVLTNLSTDQLKSAEKHVKAALKRYTLFQTGDGGFSYWPGESHVSEWGSNYAGHFMTEAAKAGYALPHNMLDRLLKYQRQAALSWTESDNPYSHSHSREAHELLQADRLYLLAEAGKPEPGAMNLMRESGVISAAAAWRLATAYYITGRRDIANQMVQNSNNSIQQYRELGYTYGSALRDKAIIIECAGIMGIRSTVENMYTDVLNELNSTHWLSTQEAAQSLRGVARYSNSGNASVIIVTDNKGKTFSGKGNKPLNIFTFSEKNYNAGDRVTIVNRGTTKAYIRHTFRGCPPAGKEIAEHKGVSTSWYFTDNSGNTISPDNINAGKDFTAVITLTNTSKLIYKEMVLRQIFASGWEISDSRLFGSSENPARYADIRDDRVNFYFDMKPGETKVFRVRLHASYEGEFYLPGPYTEAMYDDGIHSSNIGRKVKVSHAPDNT